jgi:hypothetical protein
MHALVHSDANLVFGRLGRHSIDPKVDPFSEYPFSPMQCKIIYPNNAMFLQYHAWFICLRLERSITAQATSALLCLGRPRIDHNIDHGNSAFLASFTPRRILCPVLDGALSEFSRVCSLRRPIASRISTNSNSDNNVSGPLAFLAPQCPCCVLGM